jgi:ATP-dependent DNA helicase PIF1
VVIGAMDKECPHCNALKFKNETTGMCCASGKVVNPPRLCNGTRLVIKKLMKNVVETTILNGKFRGENILLPRIPIIPTDVPIQFKRLQFPIRLAFAMTINKSQGQTMSVCGLDLSTPCFSHGQLYVACSRVGKPSSLFVLVKDGITKNIVHSIALRD